MNQDQQNRSLLNGNAPPAAPAIPGRILHCDADFLAYQSGHDWKNTTLGESIVDVESRIDDLRVSAQAEVIVLHLTLGTKGGRHEIARVAEYQGKRKKDAGLGERVRALRLHMAHMWTLTTSPHAQYDQEADDSLCQAMWRDPNAVLWSIDKDLNMVGGMHLSADASEIIQSTWGYGETFLDRSKSAPKISGKGTSFFWHQLLQGDSVDGIPGLPKLPSGKPCGAVGVTNYLKDATSDKEALALVYRAYQNHYGDRYSFMTWDGVGRILPASDMLLEQARLLWMRRQRGQDVLDFLKEVNS